MLYGGNSPMKNEIVSKYTEPNVSFSYTPKEQQEPIPMGAVIKKIEKNIAVRQIENGYIKSINTCICYEVAEKEEEGENEKHEMEMKYHYSTTETYSTEKPMDILKLYGA